MTPASTDLAPAPVAEVNDAAITSRTRPPMTPTQRKLRDAQDTFIRRWGEMGADLGDQPHDGRDPRAALHHRPAAVHGRRDGAAEHQPRQRAHEPARRCATGASSAGCTSAASGASISRASATCGRCSRIIAAERKRREMDPVLETIRQCQQMLDESSLGKAAAQAGGRAAHPPAPGGDGRVHGGDEQDLPAVHRQRQAAG